MDELSKLPASGHPSEDLVRQEQELWDAIHELCAITRSQALPETAPQPDPWVAVLITQVAALQQETLELQATIT
ncbi:hypothetical protein DSO57_1020962 [Entomophthora muscae]|uniref:Uncharacterized protein n=1 Tax=Entomophthora muscae TaxID=34485 RepID=A0ACC2TEL6_9FUNG|nr:hypothetical protein DSO57_1020962 [Entomophthora muscae]